MADQVIQINLWQTLRARLGRKVPHWAVRPLERLIRQKELNGLLEALYPRRGGDFCRGVLDELGIRLEVRHGERLPASGRYVFVSNHPLGGLDGICLIAFLREHYGTEPLAVVNDMLMAVEPLSGNFVPVNKYGSQSRGYARGLDDALGSERPVLYFPAGLVSRRFADGGVRDLEWRKTIVGKAVQAGRGIVPLYFDGLNQGSFYSMASLRKRLGIKFNAELVLLPREIFRSRGARFGISVGEPMEAPQLRGGRHAEAEIAELRRRTYEMANEQNK